MNNTDAEVILDWGLRAKYGLPQEGDTGLRPDRLKHFIHLDRMIGMLRGKESLRWKLNGYQGGLKGVLAEIRFFMAWNEKGVNQPGLASVRMASEEEDGNHVDAFMTLTSGVVVPIQIKSTKAHNGDFERHLEHNIVIVRVRPNDSLEAIRKNTVDALSHANERLMLRSLVATAPP